jgi:alpha-D-xyloside xylohydrolase
VTVQSKQALFGGIASTAAACVLLLAAYDSYAATGTFEKTANGVVAAPAEGSAKRVRLEVVSERIIRVTAVPGASLALPESLMSIPAAGPKARFSVADTTGKVIVSTSQVTAEVALATGLVTFKDAAGHPMLAEHERAAFEPVTIDGHNYYRIRQQFNPGTDEAFYGLGQHQNAQMNYNGEDVELAQHNMDIAIPLVLSSRNYGVLWDNNSITRFGNPQPYGLASRDLKIYDASGKAGGFTARYLIDGKLKVERVEPDINYQYIKDLANWPEATLVAEKSNTTAARTTAPNQTVVWEGKVESAKSGVHKFKLYASSYFKLYADGKLVLDGWRQNWNAWYHNFELPMSAGRPIALRIEWTPDNGHIALLHNDPLAARDRHSLSLASEVAHAIDYYFIAGRSLDEVIAGYRRITGKAVMLPRWAYGFWQSRQRYKTQAEVLEIAREYRKRGLPLDNVVQDWFYWREDDWGSHEFDPARFPDPQAMVEQLHAMNVHFMISVWPKFYPATRNFKELDAKGYMYRRNIEVGAKDWVGNGYSSSFYDPYSAQARSIYWRQIDERLNKLGIDAWWLDATEPDIHSNLDPEEIKRRIGPTARGPAAELFNSYPLVTTQAVYEGERKSNPETRTFILTRSGFAGLQRHAAALWSGDVASRWVDLYNQIAAGTNLSMSGIPNWTFDIGGFALEKRFEKPDAANLAEWRELNLRWFQFGAFVPLFRSHGEAPAREIYNLAPEGSEVYESLAAHDRLRYRLLPYIYTLAGDMFHRDGTMMRGLAMDFPQDARARSVNDQYLFGPAFLVNPVYKYQARSRKIYLPAGTRWFDFYSGAVHEGGREIEAAAPLARMPLFVKAGSIVPVGPAIQYTGEQPGAPITLYVYQGANGSFDLYEDDGTSYGYERGAYSRIPIRYDAAADTLSIAARSGSFPGMPAKRTFAVRWIGANEARAADFAVAADATVEYSGQPVSLKGK